MFAPEAEGVPEWASVQAALAASRAKEPDAWAAFAGCRAVEIYTDGSAPVRNPGGPAGWAAVIAGFAMPVGEGSGPRPVALARLDLGGYVAARKAEPATSNNRAEIAGILAALAALPQLAPGPWSEAGATIWSDSSYAVFCGLGTWQRKKNTDLWPILDRLVLAARGGVPGGVRLEWLKGHAGNAYNEAADGVATRAAFDFDPIAYNRYRAAQTATGREMPGAAAIVAQAAAPSPPPAAPASESRPTSDPQPPTPSAVPQAEPAEGGPPLPAGWQTGANYTLALYAQKGSRYRLWTSDGRSRLTTVAQAGSLPPAEAEYTLLMAALTDLAARIREGGRDPARYTVAVYSGQELVVKQLAGSYRVKAPGLLALYGQASALMRQFKAVTPIWKPAADVKSLF
jgi:ribonuclease HI